MFEAPEDPVLHAATEDVLLQRGPLTVPQLVTALQEYGFELEQDDPAVWDVLWAAYGAPFVHLGTRWAHLPALLLGRVFTHRLTSREIDNDLLDLSPDLIAFGVLEEGFGLHLPDGSEATVAYGPHDVPELEAERAEAILDEGSIVLPPGTLAGLRVRPGDLLSMTVTGAALQLARVDDEVVPHADATRAHLIAIASTGVPLELETAGLTLCADLDDVFRGPQPPFGELLDQTDLARNGA